MPKLRWSFAIALTFHILIVMPSIILIGKTSSLDFTNEGTKKFIDVNLFNAGERVSEKKATPNHGKVSQATNGAKTTNAQSVVPGEAETSLMNSNGDGVGIAGASQDFGSVNLHYTEPVYPKLARIRGLSGQLRIKTLVSESGEVISNAITKSSGHEILDQAALDAANKWKFQKASRQYFVEKEIIFELR